MKSIVIKINTKIFLNKILYNFINKSLVFNFINNFKFNEGRKNSIIKLCNFKIKKEIFLLKKINIKNQYDMRHNNKNRFKKINKIIRIFFHKYNINRFIMLFF
uniref:Uncharacterized protein n=1 Tax=Lotharella vacuolata TaxID=74820 RepID=A0A0H5BQS0_9EUKA|nr:hypothetical protein [Lotharella vacuolata]